MSKQDTVLALMIYETWLLNGATPETMPSARVRRWCNRQCGFPVFPDEWRWWRRVWTRLRSGRWGAWRV
jgi:hypothetical protein